MILHMENKRYQIRSMTRPEIDWAIDWAAAEGWNPGLHDADAFYAADPGGFLVGLLDGVPVATLSAVRYGDTFGFIGFYIVQPAFRAQGYGMPIWQAGLARLSGRTVGLDGVLAQQDNYRRSGFDLAYRNIRYQGAGTGKAPDDDALVPLNRLPFEQIAAYDQRVFPDDRRAFLRSWLQQPDIAAWAWVQEGQLVGYGVLRPCRTGFKVGPLLADSPAVAERLWLALQASAPVGAPLFLDTPAANPDALELARRHGLQLVFETARMYRGPAPQLPLAQLFGVTTFELG